MSERRVAKNRWHKALTSELRQATRRIGVSLDEEAAQFAFSGLPEIQGIGQQMLDALIADILNRREQLVEVWEREHPDKNPYPPSFPERMLKIVREAQKFAYDSEDSGAIALLAYLNKLQVLCENELNTDPTTEDPHVTDVPQKED